MTSAVMGLLLIFSSSVIFYIENPIQPDSFSSIPATMWWAVATLTTVGYGDSYPSTTGGRFVAVTLVLGMILFLIPMITASIASKLIVNRDAFTHEEQEEMKQLLKEIHKNQQDGKG